MRERTFAQCGRAHRIATFGMGEGDAPLREPLPELAFIKRPLFPPRLEYLVCGKRESAIEQILGHGERRMGIAQEVDINAVVIDRRIIEWDGAPEPISAARHHQPRVSLEVLPAGADERSIGVTGAVNPASAADRSVAVLNRCGTVVRNRLVASVCCLARSAPRTFLN